MVQEITRGKKIMEELNSWLMETYGVCYNKSYEVYIDNDEYSLYLHLNNSDAPMCLGGQFLSDGAFLEFLKKEMRSKRLFSNDYFIARIVKRDHNI